MRVIAHLDAETVVVEVRPVAVGEIAGLQPAVLVDLGAGVAEPPVCFGSIINHANGHIRDGAPEGLSPEQLARAIALAHDSTSRAAAANVATPPAAA